MIKLTIGIVILLAAGATWARANWGKSKNRQTVNTIIADLKSGKFVIESYADSLNAMIYSKAYTGEFNLPAVKNYLNSLRNKKILNKFIVHYADINSNHNSIVLSEVVVKEYVGLPDNERKIDIYYPCWLYIHFDEDKKELSFKSTFPENKEHQYLLEDLSSEIYNQCLKIAK
jgi:hypothetical protein